MDLGYETAMVHVIWRLGILGHCDTIIMFNTIATRRMYDHWE
jgi:hypothetical protein